MQSRLLGILIALFVIVAAILGFRLYESLNTAQVALSQPAAVAPRPVEAISFGSSRAGVIVANPVTSQVFAAEEDVPALAMMDARTKKIQDEVPLRGYHSGAAIAPLVNEIYIAQEFSQTVRVIDGATGKIARELQVPGGSPIGALAFDSTTNLVYVIQNDIGTIAALNYQDGALIATLPIAAHFGDLAINPQTARLYATSPLSNTLTVVDTTNHSILAKIPIGQNPKGIAVNPATNRVYVAVNADNVLAVLDGTNNTLLKTIPVGEGPADVVVNPTTNRVYVSNLTTKDITVIDGTRNRVLASIPLNASAGNLALLPNLNRVYAASDEAKGVFVIQDTTAPQNEIVFPSDGSVRAYFLEQATPPANWNQTDFDDSAWKFAEPVTCLDSISERLNAEAKWVWLPGCVQRTESVLFRKTFDVQSAGQRGTLRIRVHEKAQVYLNGQLLGTTDVWTTEHWFDLTPHLRQGKNVLAIRVDKTMQGGYGALLFEGAIAPQ